MEIKGSYRFQTTISNLILIVDRINWHFLGADGYPKENLVGDEATYFYIKRMLFSGDDINTTIPAEKHDLSDLIIDPDWNVDYNPPSINDDSFIIPLSETNAVLAIPFNNSNTSKEWKVILLAVEGANVKSASLGSNGIKGIENTNLPIMGGKLGENKSFFLCGDNGIANIGIIVSVENSELLITEKPLNINILSSNNCIVQLNTNTIISVHLSGGLNVYIIKITEDDNFIVYQPQNIDIGGTRTGFIGVTRLSGNTCLIAYESMIEYPGPPETYSYTKKCRVIEVKDDNSIVLGEDINLYSPISSEDLTSNPDLFVPNEGTFLSATPNGEYVLASYARTVEQPPFGSYEGDTTKAILKLLKINGKNITIVQSIENVETEKQSPTAYGYVIGYLPLSENRFLYTLVLGEKGFFYYILTVENDTIRLKKINKFVDEALDVFNIKTYNNFMFFIASNFGSWAKDYSSTVMPPIY